MAETGLSHRLTAYKIAGHFFGLSYLNISGNNQVENISLRISNILVLCPHAQLRVRSHWKVMDIFRTLGSWSLSVTAMLNFSGKANTSIHGLWEDDTARPGQPVELAEGHWSGVVVISVKVVGECLNNIQQIRYVQPSSVLSLKVRWWNCIKRPVS